METAYFITATLLCLWAYRQTRNAARSIRHRRESVGERWKKTEDTLMANGRAQVSSEVGVKKKPAAVRRVSHQS